MGKQAKLKRAKREVSSSGDGCCWVARSSLTGKWLVMAKPPGSEPRCLTVWRSKEKAEIEAQAIVERVKNFSPHEWNKGQISPIFKKFIDSLPDDDDEIVGKAIRH